MIGVSQFPYRRLQPFQTWKRAVASAALIDPFGVPKFAIRRADKVATAGSCFALHIAKALRDNGMNYYIAEAGAHDLTEDERRARHFGEYSARFGNVYTTVQLNQLFARAFGKFHPKEAPWALGDRYADPFRPRIEPTGFASVEALMADRESHLEAVAEMFRSLDVFIFTLGLTESWRCREDGAALPVCPGTDVGKFDSEKYEFANLSVRDNVEALHEFVVALRAINPNARILLTVSPVPLAATLEPVHILQATTYSKSVLRVSAEEIRNAYSFVDYVPSYEVVTATYRNAEYFEGDKREVARAAVDRVMSLFLQHFTDVKQTGIDPIGQLPAVPEPDAPSGRECDENILAGQIDRDIARFGF